MKNILQFSVNFDISQKHNVGEISLWRQIPHKWKMIMLKSPSKVNINKEALFLSTRKAIEINILQFWWTKNIEMTKKKR